MDKKTIRDIEVAGKTVLVRVDFNVPRSKETGEITNDNRIVAALPTIKYLLEQSPKAIVLFSHLGKVKTEEDKAKNNLAVVAPRLAELLGRDVKFVDCTRGAELEEAVKNAENGQVILVQNTRYEAGESKNDPELGKYWASLGDVFVEDAFGSVHRAHASTAGIPAHLPSAAGFLVEKEINYIGKAVSNPERPMVAILGGAKVSDKILVIENLLKIADKVIVGGGMCYTFAKAQGHSIGNSLVEDDRIDVAKDILAKAGDKLILPVDSVINTAFAAEGDIKVCGEDVPDGYMGLDIGPKSVENIKAALAGAKTVVWNGPMGVFEMEPFAKGTIAVCEALAGLEAVDPEVTDKADWGIATPYLALQTAKAGAKNLIVAAENVHFKDSGAYTGEVSVEMLKEIGVEWVILGHSERRQYFGETDETVNAKMLQVLKNDMTPIVCVGETLEQYEAGTTKDVVKTQVVAAYKDVCPKCAARSVIAYEPVWAIGTGKTATNEIAQDVCGYIRSVVAELYGQEVADQVRIQYGGSVKPEGLKALLEQPDIDGALVGGASLVEDSYKAMIAALD